MTDIYNDVIPKKPNVATWKSVIDVFEDYSYFHRKSGITVAFGPSICFLVTTRCEAYISPATLWLQHVRGDFT